MTVAHAAVSVVIPARDAEDYLAEAIASVLAQTVSVAEIIVVDDGSQDATGEIAKGFPAVVRCLSGAASSAGLARNRGIEASRGAFVAFLDADDLWTPDSVERRLTALQGDATRDAVFGEVEQFVCDRLSRDERDRVRLTVRRSPARVCGSMLARREVFARFGPFPTGHRVGEFIDWYLRADRAGLRTAMLPDLVLRRRVHRTNLGRTNPGGRADLLRIVRADLAARRRSESGS